MTRAGVIPALVLLLALGGCTTLTGVLMCERSPEGVITCSGEGQGK